MNNLDQDSHSKSSVKPLDGAKIGHALREPAFRNKIIRENGDSIREIRSIINAQNL